MVMLLVLPPVLMSVLLSVLLPVSLPCYCRCYWLPVPLLVLLSIVGVTVSVAAGTTAGATASAAAGATPRIDLVETRLSFFCSVGFLFLSCYQHCIFSFFTAPALPFLVFVSVQGLAVFFVCAFFKGCVLCLGRPGGVGLKPGCSLIKPGCLVHCTCRCKVFSREKGCQKTQGLAVRYLSSSVSLCVVMSSVIS